MLFLKTQKEMKTDTFGDLGLVIFEVRYLRQLLFVHVPFLVNNLLLGNTS